MKKLFIILTTFLCWHSAHAQQIEVKGIIKDAETQETIIGATILEVGTNKYASSGADGSFTIMVDSLSKLEISSLGYQKQIANAQASITISLVADANSLDEVVVVGYGTQKRSLITGSSISVSEKDLVRPGIVRADEALQGKAAGVVVTSNGGQPGEGISIRIRGTGTNGNASPLYIVDGQQLSNIDFLNPSDIESMEILKDAASSAIYGARGANGVILVTTKHGKFDEPLSIRVDASYGVQNMARQMDLLDARSYMILQNEASANGGQAMPFSSDDIAKAGKGTDWQKEILNKNAPISNANINFRGGTDELRYNVSASIFDQEGIIAPGKSNFRRYTFRENTDSKHFKNRLVFGQSFTLSYIDKSGIDVNNTWGGPLVGAINMDPVTPVRNANGSWGESPYVAQEIVNPVARLAFLHSTYQSTQLFGNAFLELELIKGLKVRSALSLEGLFDENWEYRPVYRLNASVSNLVSGTQKENSRMFGYLWENTINYEKQIDKHNLSALAGNTVRVYNGSNLGGTKNGLLVEDPAYAYLDLATNQESANIWGAAWHTALVSYFGRVNYAYDERYMMTATLRADGSTRFGPNNRFGYFPSVSAGWNITNEEFMKPTKWLDQLKLRASWGQNGNDNIGDWQYLATISSGARTYEFGPEIVAGASPDKAANPDIKWETSEQFNIGIDARIFEKFGLNLDYYIKNTKDLLVYAPIPSYVGVAAAASNAGSVRNSGIELAINYNDNMGDWRWFANFNIAYNKNKVTYVGNEDGFINGVNAGTSLITVTRMQQGLPISYFWGYQTNGLFQTNEEVAAYVDANGKQIQPNAVAGDIRFVDRNGDGVIDDNDRTMIGDPNPDVTGGLTLGLSWKKLDFSIFFSGMAGNQIFNATRRWDLPMSNYQQTALDRWHGQGTSNSYPRLTTTDANKNYSSPSDFFLEDGSFLRLKNITIGYTFDIPKLLIKSLRVYASANNLFTLTKYTGYDPEVGNSSVLSSGIDFGMYPQPRTFVVGLNLQF